MTQGTVAVTGAGGFVGRHVVAELARRGVPLALLLRESSVVLPEWSAHRIVRMHFDDAGDAYAQAGEPQTLIHLAWGGLPNYDSHHHFEVELPAHYAFCKAVTAAGVRHLVVAGTCFEYGKQSGALSETMPTEPFNAYAYAKDALRRQLQFLQAQQRFELTWARLFYMWGEGQSPLSLWPKFRAAALRGDAEFRLTGGEQLRDYLPVTEVARLLVELSLDLRGHGIVNVCSGRPMSVRSLVEGWIREYGWRIVPKFGAQPYPEHEAMAFWGDRTKLARCLPTNQASPR
jgi:dTDP-6-deoxy-L-talose 4-dehydrogenase (NAD+)